MTITEQAEQVFETLHEDKQFKEIFILGFLEGYSASRGDTIAQLSENMRSFTLEEEKDYQSAVNHVYHAINPNVIGD